MAVERRLGRGLEALLGAREAPEEAGATGAGAREIAVEQIRPNALQPRTGFEERGMAELVESIKAVGVLQPILVRRRGEWHEMIAGERRLRAAKMAGLRTVPVIERETTDDEMLALALVENLQREDLNPIEKAKGFKRLIEQSDLTQEDAAKRIGKDRSTIANFIRLLELPESVQHVVSRGTITMGHARALLGLRHASAQQALALRIENEGLSVREVERLVTKQRTHAPKKSRTTRTDKAAYVRAIEDRARERLGTRVTLDFTKGRGTLVVHLYSKDDLQRVLDVLSISE